MDHGERIAVLEAHYTIVKGMLESLKTGQERQDKKLDAIALEIAEARGEARLGKWIGHSVSALVAGAAGLFGGSVAASTKLQGIADHLGK